MQIPLLISANPKNLRMQKGPIVPINAGRWRVIAPSLNGTMLHIWRLSSSPPFSFAAHDGYEFTLVKDDNLQAQLSEVKNDKVTVYLEEIK